MSFLRWMWGHGFYATRGLTDAVRENRRFAWLWMSPEQIAEEINASLYVRGFQVMADDFYDEATGGKYPPRDAKDAARRARATE